MTKTIKSHEIMSTKTMAAIGAGAAALAAASYYFFGPKGEEHRDNLKGWMIKMKGEIIERIEDVKELTEPIYREIVDSVVATYAATSKISKEELETFAERLKGQWKDIAASAVNTKKPAVKAKKRVTKKK